MISIQNYDLGSRLELIHIMSIHLARGELQELCRKVDLEGQSCLNLVYLFYVCEWCIFVWYKIFWYLGYFFYPDLATLVWIKMIMQECWRNDNYATETRGISSNNLPITYHKAGTTPEPWEGPLGSLDAWQTPTTPKPRDAFLLQWR